MNIAYISASLLGTGYPEKSVGTRKNRKKTFPTKLIINKIRDKFLSHNNISIYFTYFSKYENVYKLFRILLQLS